MVINQFRDQNVYKTVEGDKRGKTRTHPDGVMVAAPVLEAGVERRESSSLSLGTKIGLSYKGYYG